MVQLFSCVQGCKLAAGATILLCSGDIADGATILLLFRGCELADGATILLLFRGYKLADGATILLCSGNIADGATILLLCRGCKLADGATILQGLVIIWCNIPKLARDGPRLPLLTLHYTLPSLPFCQLHELHSSSRLYCPPFNQLHELHSSSRLYCQPFNQLHSSSHLHCTIQPASWTSLIQPPITVRTMQPLQTFDH